MSDDEKIVAQFEKAIKQMQKDLAYLATNKPNLKDTFFDKQNKILRALIEYYQYTQEHTQTLELDFFQYQVEKRKQTKRLEDKIISLEAICISHGIIDFPYLMNFGKKTLIREATELGKEKRMRLPYLLNEKLDNLESGERNSILSILQRGINEDINNLIKNLNDKNKHRLLTKREKREDLLNELRQKKHILNNGIEI